MCGPVFGTSSASLPQDPILQLAASQEAAFGEHMNDMNRTNRGEITLLGILLALGLVVGGWALGAEIKATRLADRYVSVRGLAERTVKSDLATWNFGYQEIGDDLGPLYSKNEADKKTILDFLRKQGFQSSEISLGEVNVTDTQANTYAQNRRPLYRYILRQNIGVQTSRVDQVASASQNTASLLQQDIILNPGGLSFQFNGLNAIKPDMITEATRNARAAAERFAIDAGSSVGTIRQANQGVFSILAANSGASNNPDEGPNFDAGADRSVMKTVRVVTEVQFYLGR